MVFFSMLTASAKDGSGAVVMTAANASPRLFKILRALADEHHWTDFCQPARKRLQGFPANIRDLL